MPISNIKNSPEVIYMKINDLGGIKPQNLRDKEVQRKETNQPEGVTPKVQAQGKAVERVTDQVSLATKRMIEEARAKASSMPEVREEKVAEIRKQIENGTYQVSNRALARAMVGTLLSEMV